MGVLDTGYRQWARPVLFRLGDGDAETAHHRTLTWLAALGQRPAALAAVRQLLGRGISPRTVFGVDFPNAVGLAAGVDKNGVAVRAWPALGFGFAELGTVTAHPQPGNPTPRLFRLPASGAVINRMGFNNDGAAAMARRLAEAGQVGIPIGVSLGKSKITPVDEAVGDYLASLRLVHDHADYIAVNVSSPNTPGLRSLQDRGPLDELLAALTSEAAALAGGHGRPVPILVKIAPDLTDNAIAEVLQVCADRSVSGVIAVNTTLSRSGLLPADLLTGAEPGGLSGRPLAARALEVVRFVRSQTALPIIGVGGIGSATTGLAMLDAGADLLQLYTGFIYRGPGLVADLNAAIAASDRPARDAGTMAS